MCSVIDFLFSLPLSLRLTLHQIKWKPKVLSFHFLSSFFSRPSRSPQINKLALFKPLKDKETALRGIFAGDFLKQTESRPPSDDVTSLRWFEVDCLFVMNVAQMVLINYSTDDKRRDCLRWYICLIPDSITLKRSALNETKKEVFCVSRISEF